MHITRIQAMSLNLNLYLIKPMIQLSRNTILILKMHLIKRRDELGPNSIFKFHNKLYTTNHPGEETSPNSALIES